MCWEGLRQKNGSAISLPYFDYAVFHSPYNKLVRKSFARLAYLDCRSADRSMPNVQAAAAVAAKLGVDLPKLLALETSDTCDSGSNHFS